jgi:integrase
MKTGYWSYNKYYRLNVKDYVESFCGWKPLIELVKTAFEDREQSFLSCLFLTGGRVSEVLQLKRENFEVRERDCVLIVRNMPLLKRYRKVEEEKTPDSKRKWITERLIKTRKPFPISLHEPLTPILLKWLRQTPENTWLFPSPYKRGKPLSRNWAYKFIRKLDKNLTQKQRQELGLDKPFVKDGRKVSDRLHLWPHWFRSQRASQLVNDYGFEVLDLIDYFSWERSDTALTYARRGWRGLASKMHGPRLV